MVQQLTERTDQNPLVPMTCHQENAEIKIVQRWQKMKFLSNKDQRRLACAPQNMRMA